MKRKFFVLAAMIIGSKLSAQQTDTSGISLDEVVMTANKYPNKTSLTGKVVTIITREQLEKAGSRSLSQVLTENGVYINGANSNPGKDKTVFLRGARAEHTLITIDGVPVYDASGVGNHFDIRNITIDQLERIEILKGSQSTLYGSDAIAGVINLITRKPAGQSFQANGLFQFGSNNTWRANAGISGMSGIIDYNVSYIFNKTDGINETVSNGDKDGSEQDAIQAGFGIQVTKSIRLQPFVRFSSIDGDLDYNAFTDELDYTFRQKSYQAGIRNEFMFGKSKLNLVYNFNSIDRLYIDDSTESRNGFDIYSRGAYDAQEHFVEGYIVAPLGKLSKFTGGADFRTSRSDQEYFSIGFFGPFNSKNSSDSLHQNQVGAYAALDLHSGGGFSMELGNRLNFHSEYGSNYVFHFNPSYRLKNDVKLFASISSGYRTPSLYQLFSEYGNRNLQSESSISAEGGVQYTTKNNKISGRASGYIRNVKDVIFFYFDPVTFRSQYINQDEQKDHGGELELSFRLPKNITVKAFYSYVDGKIHTFVNGKDTSYNNLIRRPKHSGSIYAGSQVTDRLFFSTNVLAVGERRDSYFDAVNFQTVNVTLKSYFLWDVFAEYSFIKSKVKLFVDLRNILNADYNEVAGFSTLGFNGYGGIKVKM